MRILIAEDDAVSRRVLEATLTRWGHEVIVAHDGAEAWNVLRTRETPRMAILDWMMPEIDGVDLCKQARGLAHGKDLYLLMLTAKGEKSDVVTGLDSGADDYIIKPFDYEELRARVRAGERILGLQQRLKERVTELEAALGHVKTLQGILPICSYCKKIRDDENYWLQVESYLSRHSGAQFTHAICPSCWENKVKPELAAAPSAQERTPCEC